MPPYLLTVNAYGVPPTQPCILECQTKHKSNIISHCFGCLHNMTSLIEWKTELKCAQGVCSTDNDGVKDALIACRPPVSMQPNPSCNLAAWICMEVYTPGVYGDVPACNWCGGPNMMLLMVSLCRSLEVMQNDVIILGIGWSLVQMHIYA